MLNFVGLQRRAAHLLPLRRMTALLALVAVGCVLIVSGCGGPSTDDYERGLGTVQSQLDQANRASRAASDTTDAAERARQLGRARRAIEQAADTARALTPPDAAATPHRRLVTALDSYATLFGRLATMKPNDPSEGELYGKMGQVADDLAAANAALKRAGFRAKR